MGDVCDGKATAKLDTRMTAQAWVVCLVDKHVVFKNQLF